MYTFISMLFNCSMYRLYFDSLFFFKQKTAYEMRISDWSSDVCSSDLLALARAARRRAPVPAPREPARARPPARGSGPPRHGWHRTRSMPASNHPARRTTDARHRKSVVTGKSVSVRVDLGGRRINKKKHKKRSRLSCDT